MFSKCLDKYLCYHNCRAHAHPHPTSPATAACSGPALQGHALAQYHLGRMFEQGKGVAQDRAEVITIRWYRLAAAQGVAEATAALRRLGA
jgi:hypothetical protein